MLIISIFSLKKTAFPSLKLIGSNLGYNKKNGSKHNENRKPFQAEVIRS